MLPALRFLRHPREAFGEVRPPEGWARLEPFGWVTLFLGVHTSLLYSLLISAPHLLPAWLGAAVFVLLQSAVYWAALRLLGKKIALGESLWVTSLTFLPVVVLILLVYIPALLLTPDIFYDYFFYENLRYVPGISVLVVTLAAMTHLARVAAQETFGLSRNRAVAAGAAIALYYVGFGLLLYGFTSGDLLFVI